MKKVKTKSKKCYIRKLDSWWALTVKNRDGWICLWCGSKNNLQAAHIISRKIYSTRWLLRNGITLCARCHLFTQPNAPVQFTFMLMEKLGIKLLKLLIELSKIKVKFNYEEMCKKRKIK